jgi:hypothetical protein
MSHIIVEREEFNRVIIRNEIQKDPLTVLYFDVGKTDSCC